MAIAQDRIRGDTKLSAIVLAAGYSSRMGQLKPLLSVGPCTALEAVIELFRSADVPDICVVLGHRANELRPVAESAGARCVLNPHFDQGMFTSIQAGIAALPSDARACFMLPADIPLVEPDTVCQLALHFAQKHADIVYPISRNHRGHPTLISRALFPEILNAPVDSRLSTLLAAHQANSLNVVVSDEAIHMDMDTPEDYAAICKLAPKKLRGRDAVRLSRQ